MAIKLQSLYEAINNQFDVMPVTRDKTERPHGALLQLNTGIR